MNEMERLTRQAKRIKETYPPGTRIHLGDMNDPYSPVPSGTRGTVDMVDGIGQIHMSWDNGRTLALVPDVDSFRKLTVKEMLEEQLAGLDIDPNKMTDSARVTVCWDSYGIAVDLNYSHDEAEGYGESVLCFSEPYDDGTPDQAAWEEAQQIAHALKDKYNLPLDVLKDESFLKAEISLDELLKDAAAIEYKGIIFDDWNLDKANGSVWAEMCAGCAEKYKDIISNELDDGDDIGVCSVSGCEISGLESENKHYYIDFKPELIHPVTKDQLLQMKTSSPERKVSLDQQMIAASAKAGQTLGRGRKSGPDIPEGR